MGIFDLFKRKKKIDRIVENAEQYEYGLDIEKMDTRRLSDDELKKYIDAANEQIDALSAVVSDAKEEYRIVSAHLSDIQILDFLEGSEKDRLTDIAKEIQVLTVDRKIYQTSESKISNGRYSLYEKYEEELPQALKKLQNDERYFEAVKKDMRMMDAAKFEIKCDIKDAQSSQKTIKQLSRISIVFLFLIFGAFVITNIVSESNTKRDTAFLVVLLIAAIFVVGIVVKLQDTIKSIKESEKKLNRAIMLHNKVKIKYVNIVAEIEYQHNKYDVSNAYELGHYYGLYLEAKKEKEKYQQTTQKLNGLLNQLNDMLKSYNLYDPTIWQNEVRALTDPKEMVEVRHRYNVRRQKLRDQIENSTQRIEETKHTISMLTNR